MPKVQICKNIEIDDRKETIDTRIDEEKKELEEENEDFKKEIISKKDSFIQSLKIKNPSFIEKFELQELLGSGSESFVYKTKVKKSQRIVACKMIYKKDKGKINDQELNIGMKLKNNNITNILGASTIQKDELYFIVMECDKFGNLRNFQRNILKRDILSETLLCYISYYILNGIKYIHKCKIAHLDLKPQNITVDDFLRFKIIDFSISLDYSKKEEDKKIELQSRGTNFYMAPEVLSNDTIDVKDLNKVDLYSFGVTLYNLAFGEFPYNLSYEDSQDYDKIYEKTQTDWKVENTDNCYSDCFIDFLQKLLEKDINKRININQALNHYWIKGSNILLEEKEKLFNCSNYLLYLLTDHFKSFNDYVGKSRIK